MNKGQELFIARGKITWSQGDIKAGISKLNYFRQCHPEIDVSSLEAEMRKVLAALDLKLATNHPPKEK